MILKLSDGRTEVIREWVPCVPTERDKLYAEMIAAANRQVEIHFRLDVPLDLMRHIAADISGED